MFNPFGLSAGDLMIWGLVAHLIADWPLQNHWMATNKAARRTRQYPLDPYLAQAEDYEPGRALPRSHRLVPRQWWNRHPAAFVHAGIHGLLLAVVFGVGALPLALVHLVIDTRTPVVWWSRLIRQTQPEGLIVKAAVKPNAVALGAHLYDVGLEVRFWTDQTFHITTVAIAAVLTGSLT